MYISPNKYILGEYLFVSITICADFDNFTDQTKQRLYRSIKLEVKQLSHGSSKAQTPHAL